ncbi:MAG: hypothetical protein MHMPM18_001495 [Marteilia pararefringens]
MPSINGKKIGSITLLIFMLLKNAFLAVVFILWIRLWLFDLKISISSFFSTKETTKEIGVNTNHQIRELEVTESFYRLLPSMMIFTFLTFMVDVYFGYGFLESKESNEQMKRELGLDVIIFLVSILLSVFITSIFYEDLVLRFKSDTYRRIVIKVFVTLSILIHYSAYVFYCIVACKRRHREEQQDLITPPPSPPDSGVGSF